MGGLFDGRFPHSGRAEDRTFAELDAAPCQPVTGMGHEEQWSLKRIPRGVGTGAIARLDVPDERLMEHERLTDKAAPAMVLVSTKMRHWIRPELFCPHPVSPAVRLWKSLGESAWRGHPNLPDSG